MNKQPTEAREAANAAYLLRVSIQTDLANTVNHRDAKPESIAWHYERYVKAVERERATEALAKAEEETKQ